MTTLLTAANGKTGRAVLKALANRGADVKVFLRDEAQWPALNELGASSFAVGDMEDAATIEAAMESCDGIIHIGPPMHPNEVEITRRFIDAAKSHDLKRFVYYSVMHPLRRAVRHHRLKLDAEEELIESGLPYTIVQPIRYMQHLAMIWKRVLDTGVHNMPFSVDVKFNVADLRDLAEATAIVATEPGHLYITYELAGPEALSQRDMAATISRVLGRVIRAEALSLEQVEKNARAAGAGDDRVTQMLTMNDHYDRFGFRGNPNVLRWILGREPNTYENYVKRLASR
ncbi:MAG: NAD(P)H-binding protein [Gammaproteobacteria bacterium]|nr:NAD(P)H-binding protein [Gammaproteobacteria bacterium]MYF67315.1 NAD(P)H-binding protein [Gammaproteobacteria bacterium]MYK36748.1 NAD(P)H-binding protein [Gammaproteobacteria bacterium]